MSRFNGVYWRALRWALSVKVALVLVLASPGLLSPTLASAALPFNPREGMVLPFIVPASDESDRTLAVDCLADAIYYEAGFEPEEGQRAIAQVVLSRVRDPNFPDTVCGVVYEGWSRKTGCQFSFVCDGSLRRRPPDPDQAQEARVIAEQALSGYVVDEVGTATHYHTDYVDPYWAPTLVKVATIGKHIFYKWPGHAGEVDALDEPYQGGEARQWASIRPLRGRI
jgi:hypothetical protein